MTPFIHSPVSARIKTVLLLLLLCRVPDATAQTCNGTWGPPIINQTFGQGKPGTYFFGPLGDYAPGATTSTNFIYGQITDNYSCLTQNASRGQSSGWVNMTDHTGDPEGLMFLINAPSTAATVFFEYTMHNLCPNTVLQFSVWMLNVNLPSLTSNPTYQYPNMQINLLDVSTGAVIASSSTGNVPADQQWHNYTVVFNNTTSTDIKMQLVNYSVGSGYGNDLALDDITVSPCVPVARLAPARDTVACVGSVFPFAVSLSGNVYAAPEYSWQYSKDRGISWQPLAPPGPGATTCTFVPADTGLYWVRFLAGPTGFSGNPNCAAVSDTSFIRIAPLPPLPLVQNDTLCTGEPMRAPVVTGTNLRWYASPAGGTGAVTFPGTGTAVARDDTFYVSQTSVSGCESDRERVIVSVLQAVEMAPLHDTSVCGGNSVQLHASGAVRYAWSPAAGLSCQDCPDPVATPAQTTTYTVIGSDGVHCSDTLSLTVHVDHPKAVFQLDRHSICQGDTLSIRNTSQGSGLAYTWHFGDGATSSQAEPRHTYTTPGTYRILLLAGNGNCKDSVSALVVVDTAGTLFRFAMDTNAICPGRSIQFIPEYGPGTADIVWDFGDGTGPVYGGQQEYTYAQSGTMIVTATGKYRSCPDLSYSDTVTVFPYPLVDLGPDTVICPGNILPLANRHTDAGYTYRWSTGARVAGIRVQKPGTYILTAEAHGCVAADSIVIGRDCYLDIPNIFSPNGDGVNDFFFPRSLLSGVSTRDFHMRIYNRWGQLVFETRDGDDRGWDGTVGGRPQTPGVYVYLIEATLGSMGPQKYQGNVTLIR